MGAVRWLLGRMILFFDWLTQPRKPDHSPEKQAELDAQTGSMALYQYAACPFCVKARRAIRRLGLNIELRDAKTIRFIARNWNEKAGSNRFPACALPMRTAASLGCMNPAISSRICRKGSADLPTG